MAHAGATALPRTLGLRDLVLLEVVAIVNVSLAPPVAAFGVVSLWMWLAAFAAFFVPEAIAVITFSRREPGEGGMYLWTRNAFGDFHGFLAGWCYFTNNLFYIPMQLVFVAGVLAFAAGPQAAALVDNKVYVASVALGWLALAAGAHIRGLAVGKWVQNAGAFGTFIAVTLLAVLGVAMGSAETRAMARDAGVWELASSFSVMCFAFIGIELASTMGDEIRDPMRNVPRAIAWTGVIVLCANLLMTVAMQSLVPGTELEAIQGVMQAIERGADSAGVGALVVPLACVTALSVAGAASAWFAGASRIPFVAAQQGELPAWLGAVHARWRSPHVALGVHAFCSALLILFALAGSAVAEAYQVLLRAAVVIQLVPFVYLFVALWRLVDATVVQKVAGAIGLVTTVLGIAAAFAPNADVDNVLVFELKMIAGCVAPTAIGLLLFHYSRRGHGHHRYHNV